MQIVDTVVLLAFLDKDNQRFEKENALLHFSNPAELMHLETGHANMVTLITIWKAFLPVVPQLSTLTRMPPELGVVDS